MGWLDDRPRLRDALLISLLIFVVGREVWEFTTREDRQLAREQREAQLHQQIDELREEVRAMELSIPEELQDVHDQVRMYEEGQEKPDGE